MNKESQPFQLRSDALKHITVIFHINSQVLDCTSENTELTLEVGVAFRNELFVSEVCGSQGIITEAPAYICSVY